MILADKIQKFLKKKLTEEKLTRKDFAQKSGIPYPTVNKLINAVSLNPDFETILKIANYFNCSTNEVLKKKTKKILLENQEFNKISTEQVVSNLKKLINEYLEKNKLNVYKLGKDIGFSEFAIFGLINNKNKISSTEVILALADYFEVSIDEMIGRVSLSNQEPLQTTEPNLTSKNQ